MRRAGAGCHFRDTAAIGRIEGDALIQNGGKSVEGMEIVIGFDANSSAAALQQFKANYLKRFSSQPIFTAMEGYETMQMLVAALNKTGGNAAGLPDALTGLKDFQGLTGPIFMDQYGDAIRPLYIQRVSNGQFETIETLPPGS